MRPPRFTTRRLMVLVALCSLVMAYAGSYYRLSRRGMHEAQEFGIPGFLYVPVATGAESKNLTVHFALAVFYAPLNWIDQAIFGAPGPCISATWSLSG